MSTEHCEHAHAFSDKGHVHVHQADGTCSCGHEHGAEHAGSGRAMAIRLAVSVVLYGCGMLIKAGEATEAVLMIGAALAAGYDIIIGAFKNLFEKKFFDEYFLMTFAAIAACVIGEYEEGAAVMVLYRIGETCQDYAVARSRRALAALTGYDGPKVEGRAERFITRFARIYTPVILAMALVVAVLMPLAVKGTTYGESVYRALTFLVLACPCAIVISVPLAYFAGIGAATRKGIFFRDSTALDEAAKTPDAAKTFRRAELQGTHGYVFGGSGAQDAAVIIRGDEASPDSAVRIARRTRVIIHENVWFVIAVKLTVLVLSVLGISALWFAVFADSGVALIAILNSLRAFRVK